MAAPDNTKFQVNYKLADGTLVNLYATDIRDLETGLTDLAMVAALITSTSDSFQGSRTVASVPSAAPVAAAPAVQPVGSANFCNHGPMTYREGVGAKGPWKGYMCAAPKGATDKCQTIWVR